MKKLIIALTLFVASACDYEDSSEEKDQAAVQDQQALYGISQPVPHFDYSLERDMTEQLYRARNEHVATWTVWRSDMGTIEGDCPSTGFPLPYDTSLTNPLQMVAGYQSVTAIEQAEPNGIFASKNSTATWIRCVIDDVEAPVYVESKVTAYPFPVDVDYETNRVRRVNDKAPTVVIKRKE